MRAAPRALAAGVAMLASAALAAGLWPEERIAAGAQAVDLERMVPLEFGQWKLDQTLVPVGVSPAVRAALDRLYDQVLARAYVNPAGERVMLSIAYGADQRGAATQVHQPESCYAAQGFRLAARSASQLDIGGAHSVPRFLPVQRLLAVQGPRSEPITYWITVGDRTARPGLDRKLAQLRYGLTGRVADGMLVRVSTLGRDAAGAYAVQDGFLRDLLGALRTEDRTRLAGVPET